MEYLSAFVPHITGLIEQKRTLGYKYIFEPCVLQRLDRFCREYYPTADCLTQEIMSNDELPRIFGQTDKCHYAVKSLIAI